MFINNKPKFISDLFITTLTQLIFLLFSVFLIKIMTIVLSKKYFGIFIIIKRILSIGVPLITLNLPLGLTRYVSYEEDKRKEFLNIILWTIIAVSIFSMIIISLLYKPLSILFFKSTHYSLFLFLTGFYILGYNLFQIAYAFFRGKQNMVVANKLQILYCSGSVLFILLIWLFFKHSSFKILCFYLLFVSLWSIFLGIKYISPFIIFLTPYNLIKKILTYKELFNYSIIRIPSGFLLALTLGIPVFIASHKLSLIDAAYVGIGIAVLKLLGALAFPINLLFLPKFAEIKKRKDLDEIKKKGYIIIEFIITFLPILSVLTHGLAKYIILIFFGKKYIITISVISIIILFSPFYISYIIIRGILDGLFYFPYVNIICSISFIVTTTLCFIFFNNFKLLIINLCIGICILGILSVAILIKKCNIFFERYKFIKYIIIISSVYLIVHTTDCYIIYIKDNLLRFLAIIFIRILLFFLMIIYWKYKSIWYNVLKSQIKNLLI